MGEVIIYLQRALDRVKDEPVVIYGLIAAAMIYFDVDPEFLGEASEEIEALTGLGLAGVIRALVTPMRRVLARKKGHPESDDEDEGDE